jgi:hypothetical protein
MYDPVNGTPVAPIREVTLEDIERRLAAVETKLDAILEQFTKAVGMLDALREGGLPGIMRMMRG